MEIKLSTGAVLVPADNATAEQFLKYNSVVDTVVEEEVKTKSKKKIVTE